MLLVPRVIKLPKLDGLSVLKRIRQYPGGACTPAISLPSSDDAKDTREVCRLGASSNRCNQVSAQCLHDYRYKFHEQAGKAN